VHSKFTTRIVATTSIITTGSIASKASRVEEKQQSQREVVARKSLQKDEAFQEGEEA
jgi:hypothetical protein